MKAIAKVIKYIFEGYAWTSTLFLVGWIMYNLLSVLTHELPAIIPQWLFLVSVPGFFLFLYFLAEWMK